MDELLFNIRAINRSWREHCLGFFPPNGLILVNYFASLGLSILIGKMAVKMSALCTSQSLSGSHEK